MKPSKITWSESRESVNEIGLKSWRKAGVEIELEDSSVEKAFADAKGMVANALNSLRYFGDEIGQMPMENSPSMYPPNVIYATNQNPLPTIDYSAKEKVEKAIDNAESLVELEGYMSDALQYKIVPQYNAKRKTFIEGKIN